MPKQFIQPKGVSFLNYAIFFDKGSFVFDFIKGVLFFKILNFCKSMFFLGRILFLTGNMEAGECEDECVKKEALHDKRSFIFQKQKKKIQRSIETKHSLLDDFLCQKGRNFLKNMRNLVEIRPFLRYGRKSSVQKQNGFCFDKGSFFFQNL